MRELRIDEIRSVHGGHPLAAGFVGAVLAGVHTAGEGGGLGDIALSATLGFATGTYGAMAFAARSVYYGAVTFGYAYMGGMARRDRDNGS